MSEHQVGNTLLQQGAITLADIQELGAGFTPEMLTRRELAGLVRQGKLKKDRWGQALSALFGKPYVSISELEISGSVLDLLPESFIREKEVFPVSNEGGRLVLAMLNPNNRAVIDEITFMTGIRPQVVVTTDPDFETACKHNFGMSTSALLEDIDTGEAQNAELTAGNRDMEEANLADPNSPVVKFVNRVLDQAIAQGASDVHIEPRSQKTVIRFRVDGILRTVVEVPAQLQSAVVSRFKVMGRMDITEHRKPQDGRATHRWNNTDYNMRLNTLPVGEHKEKVVLRILRPAKNVVGFAELGFTNKEIRQLEYLYRSPYGIVLVCGPTGSGKTTTLYSILRKVNQDSQNVSTVEDPIELTIEGLNQSQVNHKAEYTFAKSLRALMRQDPDVLMVGEIRDHETLESAIHAALTGHLVFSTIHANTAISTISRMVEMGASPGMIASTINGVVAQRLVRRLCERCRESYPASENDKKFMFPGDLGLQQAEFSLFKAKGCTECGNSGYSGRVGIYEILIMNRELRKKVSENRPDLELEDAAIAGGLMTLGRSAIEKVIEGKTSVEEVMRVFGSSIATR